MHKVVRFSLWECLLTCLLCMSVYAGSYNEHAARLFFTSKTPVRSENKALSVIKEHKDDVRAYMRSSYPTMLIATVRTEGETNGIKRSVVSVSAEHAYFLFDYTKCTFLGYTDTVDGALFPAQGLLYRVMIPVIIEGDGYIIKEGTVSLADPSAYARQAPSAHREEEIIRKEVSATPVTEGIIPPTIKEFVVDEDGNIYDEGLCE